MGYAQYGIKQEFVERVKRKMKNKPTKEKVRKLLDNVTKHDLQDRAKVKRLVKSVGAALQEPLSPKLEDQLVSFVLDQKIDPGNGLQLLKLWSMFR